MDHIRRTPRQPQTQGKIERWYPTLKNRVLLENHCLPGALDAVIGEVTDHDNHRRYHESPGDLMPAGAGLGKAETILPRRKEIKASAIESRRLMHHQARHGLKPLRTRPYLRDQPLGLQIT